MNEREQDAEDKTEDASDERRKQFREEGNIASPREAVSSVALCLFVMLMSMAGPKMFADFGLLFQRTWGSFNPKLLSGHSFLEVVYYSVQPLIPWVAGASILLLFFPILTGLLFTRFNFSTKKITFDMSKMNPISGVQRLFGFAVLVELLKNLAKLTIVSSVLYVFLKNEIPFLSKAFMMDLRTFLSYGGDLIYRMFLRITVASFLIAFADFGYNWWKIERDMKMTKQDLKQEYKSQEGDPHAKSARKRMAREFATKKTFTNAATATFIVTNPEHFAVAIKYRKGMSAPVIVAKGQDFLALKIREIAKANDIIIVENKPLARTLYKTVKVGQEVPSSLYASVIEVMKYIHQTRGREYFDRTDGEVAPVKRRPAPAS